MCLNDVKPWAASRAGREKKALERGADRRSRVFGAAHRNDLEVDQIPPIGGPSAQVLLPLGLHDLEASREVKVDPARQVPQTLGGHAASLPETPIDLRGLSGAET